MSSKIETPHSSASGSRGGGKSLALFSAVIALLGVSISGVALYLNNRPKPAATLGGQMSVPIARVQHTLAGYQVEIRVKANLQGLKGKTASIRWTLQNATTGQAVPNLELVQQPGPSMEAEADSDTANPDFRLPKPLGGAVLMYTVYLELLGPNGTLLDERTSAPFAA